MQQTCFKRFLNTQTMMEAELELLQLGEGAIPILASFSRAMLVMNLECNTGS
jgi:hypothetical protein